MSFLGEVYFAITYKEDFFLWQKLQTKTAEEQL